MTGQANQVKDIKEGNCYDNHWVYYENDQSLSYTLETNTIIYVNLT